MSRLGRRIVVELTHEDFAVLKEEAEKARRTPQDQAAIYLEHLLRTGEATLAMGEAYPSPTSGRRPRQPWDNTAVPASTERDDEDDMVLRYGETREDGKEIVAPK